MMRAGGVLIYGAPGAGKSTLGRYASRAHGLRFADGDDWLPTDLVATLQRGESFSDAERDRFAEIIVDKIRDLKADAKPFVVAQALLKRRQRRRVRRAHPDLLFLRAAASDDELRRRLRLGGNLVDDALGARMNQLLEVDPADPVVSDEHGDVYAQLDAVLRGAGLAT